ncbi:MAG: hypothetical protein U0R68_06070 [Candidatus Nanopelagicales bacterium]
MTRDQVIHDAYTTMTWLSTLEGTEHDSHAQQAYAVVEQLLGWVRA